MHLEYFDYFYKVAKVKSISKVAVETNISQPALSQQISKFEETIGYKLLDRSNKGVKLTNQGEIVYQYAENILKTYNSMIEDLKLNEIENRNLKVEACWPISDFILPEIIGDLKRKYSNVDLKLCSDNFDNIYHDVENNVFEFGITYKKYSRKSVNNSDVNVFDIGVDSLVLLANTNYDIPDEITVQELKNYPLIFVDDKLGIMNVVLDYLADNGCEGIQVDFETDSVITVINYLLTRNAMTFLPYLACKKYVDNGYMKVIRLRNFSYNFPISALTKKGTTNSFIDDLIKQLINYVEDNKYRG